MRKLIAKTMRELSSLDERNLFFALSFCQVQRSSLGLKFYSPKQEENMEVWKIYL